MNDMDNYVQRWWVYLITGILALILGIWSIFTPLSTLSALVILFSVSFFAKGLIEISTSIFNRKSLNNWGWYLSAGLLDIIFGLILILYPLTATFTLFFMIGFWVLFQSIWNIVYSVSLLKLSLPGAGFSLVLSILGLILALILIWNPASIGSFIVYMFAFALIFYGISRISLAIILKKK